MSDFVQKHHAIVISNSVHHSKKMAAVHFTTIPCELNTRNQPAAQTYFYDNRPGTNNIVYVSFDFSDFFVCFYQRVQCFRALRITDKIMYWSPSFSVQWINPEPISLKHYCSSTVDSNIALYSCLTHLQFNSTQFTH